MVQEYILTSGPDLFPGDLEVSPDDSVFVIALAGNDTVVGTSLSDLIFGNENEDILTGLDGDDTIYGGQNPDTIDGGIGNDLLLGNLGIDLIDGGSGNDIIYGGGDDDIIVAGEGNDTVYAGLDNDSVDGGGGDDSLFGQQGSDTILAGLGNDTVYAGQEADTVLGNEGNDFIFGNLGDDSLVGGEGDDYIHGGQDQDTLVGELGNDTLVGGKGNDSLDGGEGDDSLFGNEGQDTIIGGLGDDTVYAGQDADTVFGNEGNDSLFGNLGDDSLFGGQGDDYISGGQDQDTIVGGQGKDTVIGGLGNDLVIINADDAVAGEKYDGGTDDNGLDIDTLLVNGDSDISGSEVINFETFRIADGVTLTASLEQVASVDLVSISATGDKGTLQINATKDDILASGVLANIVPSITVKDIDGNIVIAPSNDIVGTNENDLISLAESANPKSTDGNDNIRALAGDDTVFGAGGSDTIDGGDGNDQLWGGIGFDSIFGGSGNDTIGLESGDAQEDETYDGGDGTDTLLVKGDSNILLSRLISIEKIVLANGVILTLSPEQVAGVDTIAPENEGDQVIIRINDTAENIQASDALDKVAPGVTVLDKDGNSVVAVPPKIITGTEAADLITPNAANEDFQTSDGKDEILGLGGNDTIDGAGGNDTITAGAGDDSIIGGAGKDSIDAGEGNDTLIVNPGDAVAGETYDGGDGVDTLLVKGDSDLSDSAVLNIENLVLADGVTVILTPEQIGGIDEINTEKPGDEVTIQIDDTAENIQDSGIADQVGEGVTIIDQDGNVVPPTPPKDIVGTEGADLISPNATNPDFVTSDLRDNIVGLGGNDTIDAAGGNDTIAGGAGDDLIDASAGNDSVDGGDGKDTITGGTGNDTIAGGAGNDSITGGAGKDSIDAGEGDDSLIIEDGDAVAGESYDGGDGNDTLFVNGNSDLTDSAILNIENLVLADGVTVTLTPEQAADLDISVEEGGEAIIVIDDTLENIIDSGIADQVGDGVIIQDPDGNVVPPTPPNIIIGTDEPDLIEPPETSDLRDDIDGLGGNDTINSAGGNDTVNGGAGDDLINAGAGNDSVDGGDGNDTIDGAAGNDTINGQAGNDSLIGGAGQDSVYGGEGDDTLVINEGDAVAGETYDGGEGTDTLLVNGDSDLTDSIVTSIENLVLADGVIATLTPEQAAAIDDISAVEGGEGTLQIDDTAENIQNSGIFEQVADNVTVTDQDGNVVLPIPTPSIIGTEFADLIGPTATNPDFVTRDLAEEISGLGGNDTIDGAGGSDTITGGAGNDSITGGAGKDSIDAGIGNDILVINEGDVVAGETYDGGEGIDTLSVKANSDLTDVTIANIENLELADGVTVILTPEQATAIDEINPENPGDEATIQIDDTFENIQNSGIADQVGDGITITDQDGTVVPPTPPNSITGTDGDDLITPDATNPDFVTSDAKDNITGLEGNDTIDGAGGNDTINAGAGNDSVNGGAGNDSITAGIGNDIVGGDSGNDTIAGGSGNDIIDGGAGDDSVTGETGDDIITGGAGQDFVDAGEGDDNLIINDGDAVAGETYNGGAGNDTLSVNGDSDLSESTVTGIENLVLADGVTVVLTPEQADAIGTITPENPGDIGTIQINDTPENIIASGIADEVGDGITIVDQNGQVVPPTPPNVIEGTEGPDLITPNATNPDFVTTDGKDEISALGGNDTIDGAGGNDTINGGAGDDNISGGDGTDSVNGGSGSDSISGGAGNDTLIGDIGNDTITGDAGNDSVTGGAGNDSVTGGAGQDFVDGGEGDDILVINEGDAVPGETYDGGDGTDTLSVKADSDLSESTLTSIEILELADGVTAILTIAQAEAIGTINTENIGETATIQINDTAANILSSGILDQVGDGITVTDENGNPVNVTPDKTITGTNGPDLISPNAATDALKTTDGNDKIDALAGNDTIDGAAGNDTITGAAGNDSITGGLGKDSIDAGVGNDILVVNEGDVVPNETYNGGDGNDTLSVKADSDFSEVTLINIENLELADGVTVTLTPEQVDAIGEINPENPGDTATIQINDTAENIEASGIADQVGDGIVVIDENGAVVQPTPPNPINGSPNADLIGPNATNPDYKTSDGKDNITGAGGNDTIDGAGGNDTIDGGAGNDSITGGAGNDSILGGDGSDFIDGSSGNDTISGDAGNDTITGGTGNDTITGGTGNDSITGGAGQDSVTGGAGNDTLVVNEGEAVAGETYDGGADTDTLLVNGDSDLSDSILTSIENLLLANNATAILTPEQADVLENISGEGTIQINDTAANIIDSGIADQVGDGVTVVDQDGNIVPPTPPNEINGTTGPDIITPTATDPDLITTDGKDIITAFAGSDNIDGAGGNDSINGGAGNDTILGGDGNDTIDGGTGNDSITGGAGIDSINAGTGNDILVVNEGDAVAGETYDGGEGIDTLSVNGDSDFSGSTITGIENLLLANGVTATLTPEQAEAIDNFNAVEGGEGIVQINDTPENIAASGLADQVGDNITVVDQDGNIVPPTLPKEIKAPNTTDQADLITPTSIVPELQTTDGKDIIEAQGGNDTINGAGGNDIIDGGTGNDIIDGGTGNDTIDGGTGNDSITGGVGLDSINAGDNDDTLIVNEGDAIAGETYDGGAGNDTLSVQGYADFSGSTIVNIEDLLLANGATAVLTPAQADAIGNISGQGTVQVNDTAANITASGLADSVGENVIVTDQDGNVVPRTPDNIITGSPQGDDITPTSANPDYQTVNTRDIINALGGNDTINAIGGNDVILGGTGDDSIKGGDGDDTITGGAEQDSIDAGAGNDVLIINNGDVVAGEIYIGGDGNDVLQVKGLPSTTAADLSVVTTFNTIERIQLDKNVFLTIDSVDLANVLEITGNDNTKLYVNQTNPVNTVITGIPTIQLESTTASTFDAVNVLGTTNYSSIDSTSDLTITNIKDNISLFTISNTSNSAFTASLTQAAITAMSSVATVKLEGTNNNPTKALTIEGVNTNDGITTLNLEVVQDPDLAGGLSTFDLIEDGAQNDLKTINITGNVVGTPDLTLGGAGAVSIPTTVNKVDASTYVGDLTLNKIGATSDITITGGTGDDTFNFNPGIYGPTDTINGGGGTDTLGVSYTTSPLLGITLNNIEEINITSTGALTIPSITNTANTITGINAANVNGLFTVTNPVTSIANNATVTLGNDGSLFSAAGSPGTGITITGGTGIDIITGSSQADTLNGDDGNDSLSGGAGLDLLNGGAGNDTLNGGDANDTLNGDDGNDTLSGGLGLDSLNGGAGTDILDGGAGNDILNGGADNDSLIGGAESDVLVGGEGDDTLTGGADVDNLTGGAGSDQFNYLSPNDLAQDTIADFVTGNGNDIIAFSNAISGVDAGTAAVIIAQTDLTDFTDFSNFIVIGNQVELGGTADSNLAGIGSFNRFALNTDTDSILYDFDGNGPGTSVNVALVSGIDVTTLVANNFAFIA